MSIIYSILIFVVILSILVVVHECGHFLTARMFGVKVNEFAIGFGPRIYKKQGKVTLFSIRCIPLGGFVTLEGEDKESNEEGSFSRLAPWKKFLVLFNGAFLNLVLGFIIILLVTTFTPGRIASTTVARFVDDKDAGVVSISDDYGLRVDDTIVKVGGAKVNTMTDVFYELAFSQGKPVDLTIIRDGKKLVLNDVMFPESETQGMKMLNVDFKVYGVDKNAVNVVKSAYYDTLSNAKSIYVSLKMLITGTVGVQQMSGPVGMTQMVGQVASYGLLPLLQLMALLSINLGIVNLLPFPALDGGRIVFTIAEMVLRRKINPKYEGTVHFIGFALLMVLMVIITFSDIVKIFI